MLGSITDRRKITQIAACQSESTTDDGGTFSITYGLYALCDDGTVWDYQFGDKQWLRMAAIPQDE